MERLRQWINKPCGGFTILSTLIAVAAIILLIYVTHAINEKSGGALADRLEFGPDRNRIESTK